MVVSKGIATSTIAERVDAGVLVNDIAADYDLAQSEIEQAVVYERAERAAISPTATWSNSAGDLPKAGGQNVERHVDHFAPDTPDDVWLAEVGRRGWTALTHDKRIRYKPNERDAVIRHRVGLLVIVGAAPFADLAHAFLGTLPSIQHFLDKHEPPFIAKVYRPSPSDTTQRGALSGRVELWYPR